MGELTIACYICRIHPYAVGVVLISLHMHRSGLMYIGWAQEWAYTQGGFILRVGLYSGVGIYSECANTQRWTY